MPILEQIRTCITELLFTNIFSTYDGSKEINKSIQTQILPQNAEIIGTGTYGNLFLNEKIVYKIMILKPIDNDTNMKKIINTAVHHRQYYVREYKVHVLANQIQDLTCRVYEFKSFGPICYITMQYLQKYITLADYLEYEQAYSLENNDIISRLLINKMDQLQKLKIYHGDIKQTNVMIKLKSTDQSKQTVVDLKIIDFGKSYTYQYIEQLSHDEYKRYHAQQNYYNRWKMLQKRSLLFHQNFHYSSILQYIFNEYLHKEYHLLTYYLEIHSAAFTILHIYNRKYINDFKRDSYLINFQKFIAHYLILLGPQVVIDLIKLGNSSSQIQSGTQYEYNNQSEESYSSFDEHDSMNFYYEIQHDVEDNASKAQLEIPLNLKNLISIHNNNFYISNKVSQEIEAIKDTGDYTMEYYLEKIQDLKIRESVKSMIYTFSSIRSLCQSVMSCKANK